MAERIYLDWNATAPLRPQAGAAALEAFGVCGNPSSVHAEGRAVRRRVEEARASVAALVGAEPRNVVFTSGGTEANMMALSPFVATGQDLSGKDLTGKGLEEPRDCLLISAIEHPSVLAGGRFPPSAVERVPVTPDGRIDLAVLARQLAALAGRGLRRPLVSVMLANNETGVLQPVAEAAALAHAAGGLMHVDAVQACGRISCNINELQADLLTLSGHKIGGPKGVGALIKRDQALHFTDPLIKGGGQERGARAGTENVAAIVGFGAAAALARSGLAQESAGMAALRDRLEAGLKLRMPAAIIFGMEAQRLPNTTLFAVPGIKAETAVIALDLDGIAVSSGAACSSGKVQPSHVLAAMGVGALAKGAIRVSLGPTTSESEVDRFLDAWIRLSKVLLKGADGIAA
jgi:cysteine desulfurase